MTDIVADTSAIVEVMIDGPRAKSVREALNGATLVFASPVARVETALVVMGRFGWDRATFDRNWQALGLDEIAVDASIASLAIDAFEAWGKGRSAAGLNFGDCFSYALATARSVPLLFVGDDFASTDIARI